LGIFFVSVSEWGKQSRGRRYRPEKTQQIRGAAPGGYCVVDEAGENFGFPKEATPSRARLKDQTWKKDSKLAEL
jgi:hypothetical protein